MRKIVTFIFALQFSIYCFAQNGQVDSLKNQVLIGRDDTTQVNNLILLSRQLGRTNPEEAILYGNKARELAEQIGFKKSPLLKDVTNLYVYEFRRK